MAVTIAQVLFGSPAWRKKIVPGDVLLCVNGNPITDVLDYRFHITESKITLLLDTPKGNRTVRIRKKEYEDIGLEFETYLMDKQHTCRNGCIFCFIDQMPKGMRESLYFKDDDSRLSFLFGNYITLTNLSEHEIERILQMHISPINISVHTTNPELRCKMMNNRFAGETLKLMNRFAKAGIHMECQLVLCPGWNDGEELERSMHDLAALAPAVKSIAVVPVGLTKHREGLTPLRPFTAEEAVKVIDAVERFGNCMLAATGERVVYPADEWYLLAGKPIPKEEFYGDMPQLDNGVGLIALLRSQFMEALENTSQVTAAGTETLLLTGVAAAPLISDLLALAKEKFPQINARVQAVKNEFFGETITVAGLVTGTDIFKQVVLGEAKRMVIPDVMLRHEGDRFLDDVTLQDLEEKLGVSIQVLPVDGEALLSALLQ